MGAQQSGPSQLLADGERPATPPQLFTLLDRLEIVHQTVAHPAVFTVDEARSIRHRCPGGHSKNLFLRNKPGRMWLLCCEESRTVDLAALAVRLDCKRLSFARPERLMRFLGVIPGAVSPFAIINDHLAQVQVLLDASLLTFEVLNFHPLDNTLTTSVPTSGLLRFLEALEHPPQLVELE